MSGHIKIKRRTAKMLALMLMAGMLGNAGTAYAENTGDDGSGYGAATSEEAADKETVQAAPESIEAVDVTEITVLESGTEDGPVVDDTESAEKKETEDIEKFDEEKKKVARSKDDVTYEKSLFKDNAWTGGKPDSDKELENGATVSFSDELIVQYVFALSPENVSVIAGNDEKTYTLTCPESLQWKAGEEKNIVFTNGEGKDIKFAALKQEEQADGTVMASLTFVDNLEEVAADGIDEIFVYLGCQLDKGKLDAMGGPEEGAVRLAGDKILTLKILENQPKSSALTEKKEAIKTVHLHGQLNMSRERKNRICR